MLSFIWKKPLFRVPLRIGMPGPYLFDLLSLFFVLAVYLGLDDLKGFARHAAVAEAPANAFALIGTAGIYGVRLAMWVAILRRNRMPQTAEWLTCLIPLAAALACFVFSGPMVRAYAAQHHYQRCADRHDHGTIYVFTAPGATCPAATSAA